MLRTASRGVAGLRRTAAARFPNAKAAMSTQVSLEGFGDHVFKGDVAKPYLEKQGLPGNILDTPAWCKDAALADKVSAHHITSAPNLHSQ
jgi:hypothetical protein